MLDQLERESFDSNYTTHMNEKAAVEFERKFVAYKQTKIRKRRETKMLKKNVSAIIEISPEKLNDKGE